MKKKFFVLFVLILASINFSSAAQPDILSIIGNSLGSDTVAVSSFRIKELAPSLTFKRCMEYLELDNEIKSLDKICNMDLLNEIEEVAVAQNASEASIIFIRFSRLDESAVTDIIIKTASARNIILMPKKKGQVTEFIPDRQDNKRIKAIEKLLENADGRSDAADDKEKKDNTAREKSADDGRLFMAFIDRNTAALTVGPAGRDYLLSSIGAKGEFYLRNKNTLKDINSGTSGWLMLDALSSGNQSASGQKVYSKMKYSGAVFAIDIRVAYSSPKEAENARISMAQTLKEIAGSTQPDLSSFLKCISLSSSGSEMLIKINITDKDLRPIFDVLDELVSGSM